MIIHTASRHLKLQELRPERKPTSNSKVFTVKKVCFITCLNICALGYNVDTSYYRQLKKVFDLKLKQENVAYQKHSS